MKLKFSNCNETFQPQRNYPTSPGSFQPQRNFPTSDETFQLRAVLSNLNRNFPTLESPTELSNCTFPVTKNRYWKISNSNWNGPECIRRRQNHTKFQQSHFLLFLIHSKFLKFTLIPEVCSDRSPFPIPILPLEGGIRGSLLKGCSVVEN